MKKYQMVVSDFDGTLFRSDHTISKKSKETINKFVESGGVFAISTGRSLQSILPVARGLGLKGVMACSNGAAIVDIEGAKLIFEKKHTVQDTYEVCKILEDLGVYTQVFDFEKYYAKEPCEYLEIYQKITAIKPCLTGKPISEFVKENSIDSVKILCIIEESKRDELLEKIKKLTNDRFYLTSGMKYFIEICPKGVSKGAAVEFLADYYNIPIENVIAVGDGLNDLPMLEAAGLGLAVENAETALKEVVKVFPYTNDENAVARIIEQYALKEM